MVNFNYAFTAPINPPNASPVLTVPQIWAGLQRKIRFAHEFVPVIESCEIISDENDVVTRVVKFKKGMGPGAEGAKEIVRGWEPSWVDFEQEGGAHIRNVISESDQGLNMTYMFEIRHEHVQEGEAAEKELARLKGLAKHAVVSSIDVIREMVKDGRITA